MIKRLQSLPTSALLIYCGAATAFCFILLTKVATDSQTIDRQAKGIQLQVQNIATLQAQIERETGGGGGINYTSEMEKVEKLKKDRLDEYKRQQQIVDSFKK
jgi:Tfp pilus assembly protein PilN